MTHCCCVFLCVFVYLCVCVCKCLFARVCGLYVKCRKAGHQRWIRPCCFIILSKEMQTSKPYIPEISHQHCWRFESQMWTNSAFTDTNTHRDTHTWICSYQIRVHTRLADIHPQKHLQARMLYKSPHIFLIYTRGVQSTNSLSAWLAWFSEQHIKNRSYSLICKLVCCH